MVSNYKTLPKFDEAMPYECWKNEVNVWRRVTELDKKEEKDRKYEAYSHFDGISKDSAVSMATTLLTLIRDTTG